MSSNNSTLQSIANSDDIVILLDKNFFESGRYEKLLSYETRPEINSFRAENSVREGFINNFIAALSGNYPFEISSNYKKILEIEKVNQVIGVINLNIDGLLRQNGAQKLIELEGNICWFYCSNCGMDKETESIINSKDNYICNGCNDNVLKPSIPFLGQEFSQWDLKDSWMVLNKCQNLVIFSDTFLSPVTISFIDIVSQRSKKTFIVSNKLLDDSMLKFPEGETHFITSGVDSALDLMMDIFGNKLT